MNNEFNSQNNNPNVAPMPATNQNVTPTPMPAAPGMVNATPMGAPTQSVAPQPVQPQMVGPQPVTPTPQAVPTAAPQTVVPGPAPAAPQAEIPSASNEDVAVISTVKKKTSNIVLIIVLILLVLFVLNIDTAIEYYEKYMEGKNQVVIDDDGKDTDNTNEGYLVIGENVGHIKLKDIKFYYFTKAEDSTINVNYEALATYEDSKTLNIYIELYNSEKELLYKEIFDAKQKVEKNTVRIYPMVVSADVYQNAYYGIAKVYTEEESNTTSKLVCTKEDTKFTYKNTYIFVNNGLSTYEVYVQEKDSAEANLEEEYKKLDTSLGAKYENGVLQYTIDTAKDTGDYKKLYEANTVLTTIKDKETLKEWKCE